MKITRYFQSQLLFRKSYKPNRIVRFEPARPQKIVARPATRYGAKPRLEIVP